MLPELFVFIRKALIFAVAAFLMGFFIHSLLRGSDPYLHWLLTLVAAFVTGQAAVRLAGDYP